jgi:L-asparagine transporter-like permease
MNLVDFLLIHVIIIIYVIVTNYVINLILTNNSLNYNNITNTSITVYIISSVIAILLYKHYKDKDKDKDNNILSRGLKYSSIVLLISAILTSVPSNSLNIKIKLLILLLSTVAIVYYFEHKNQVNKVTQEDEII